MCTRGRLGGGRRRGRAPRPRALWQDAENIPIGGAVSSPALPARRPRESMTGRLTLLVGSVLVTLFLLEIGCRLVRGPEALLDWRNIVLAKRLEMYGQNLGHPFAYDP